MELIDLAQPSRSTTVDIQPIFGHESKSLIGTSAPMVRLRNMIDKAASFPASVLIYGETGVGKELVARAIHERSREKNGRFVPVHLAAMPESLVESELFGHEKGAFTGADEKQTGLFELADGGTLFIDEVGTIPASFQAKLLRVLQERAFRRLGGHKIVKANFRVIAATNVDLYRMVRMGRFRQDLFYRLNVIPLVVPALRERQEDITLLTRYYFNFYGGGGREFILTSRAINELCHYAWPGNVRELENVIQRTLAFADGPIIDHFLFDDPPESLLTSRAPTLFYARGKRAWDREMLVQCLKKYHGSVNEVATALRVDRRTIQRKMKQFNLNRESFLRSQSDGT